MCITWKFFHNNNLSYIWIEPEKNSIIRKLFNCKDTCMSTHITIVPFSRNDPFAITLYYEFCMFYLFHIFSNPKNMIFYKYFTFLSCLFFFLCIFILSLSTAAVKWIYKLRIQSQSSDIFFSARMRYVLDTIFAIFCYFIL